MTVRSGELDFPFYAEEAPSFFGEDSHRPERACEFCGEIVRERGTVSQDGPTLRFVECGCGLSEHSKVLSVS